MTNISRSALLPYPADKVYALINDVEAYPNYMEGCVGAEVLSRDEQQMVARLDLSRGGISQSFTTRNRLQPPLSVELQLVEGPFEHFEGRWTLLALSDNACKVTLSLRFTLNSGVLTLAVKQLFTGAANSLVDAMVKRAGDIYGR